MNQVEAIIENGDGSPPPAAFHGPTDHWERDALARFRRGEVEAFEEFVLRYQGRLYNVIYQMSCDESETRDVVQETFLKAFQSLGGFHGESKVGTWLHRIAVNTFIHTRRKSRPEPMDNLTLEQFQLSSREAMDLRPARPDEVFEKKETRTLLKNAIARLPEKLRAVLVLRDLEDRLATETAEILDVSIPAVKARLHRARLHLHRELQQLVSSGTRVRNPQMSRDRKKGEASRFMRRPMKQLASLSVVALLMVGCPVSQPTQRTDRGPSMSAMYDGQYDNHPLLVKTRQMRLARIIESLYVLHTDVTFRANEDGRLIKQSLKGTAVALFGRFLLTVEHVVSLDEMTADTPFGRVVIPAKKVSERTVLEHSGHRYELEPLVMDKAMDVALFRLPEGLSLRSFPYRIGNSDDLHVGNCIYSVGNPMNLGINVREGIVSSLKAPRVISQVNGVAENAFMVSNGLNPGDSGTPVIAIRDGEYELVGLSQGTFHSSQRLGWVIRINKILRRIRASLGTQQVALASH